MKQHIELSPRLRLAADLVPQGARLADVGTDHAYLPACLLLEGKIPWAIASDLRKGPLDRAVRRPGSMAAGIRWPSGCATVWQASVPVRWTPSSSPGWGARPLPRSWRPPLGFWRRRFP